MASSKIPNRVLAKNEPMHISLIDRKRENKFGSYEYEPLFATIALEVLSATDHAKTKAHVCAALQCSKDTLLKWMAEHTDFAEAITTGLKLGEAKWREKIREHAFSPTSEVNNGLIKLLSANVYGMKEEPQIVINNQQGKNNLVIDDNMSAKEAAQAYSDLLKEED